jgi:hypothetical protein
VKGGEVNEGVWVEDSWWMVFTYLHEIEQRNFLQLLYVGEDSNRVI